MASENNVLTEKRREILVKWMRDTCAQAGLRQEIPALGERILNRYLATKPPLLLTTIQLIGLTSLILAAKAEEIEPLPLSEWQCTCKFYSLKQIREMEITMLIALDWQLGLTEFSR